MRKLALLSGTLLLFGCTSVANKPLFPSQTLGFNFTGITATSGNVLVCFSAPPDPSTVDPTNSIKITTSGGTAYSGTATVQLVTPVYGQAIDASTIDATPMMANCSMPTTFNDVVSMIFAPAGCSGCHAGATPQGSLNLATNPYMNIVGVAR